MATNDKLKARIAKRKKQKADKRAKESNETKRIRNQSRARVAAWRTIHQDGWIGKTSNDDITRQRQVSRDTWRWLVNQQLSEYNKWVSNWTRKPATNKTVSNIVNRFSNIIKSWWQKKFDSFKNDAYKASQSPRKYTSFAQQYNPQASQDLINSQQQAVSKAQWQNRLDNVYKALYTTPDKSNGTGEWKRHEASLWWDEAPLSNWWLDLWWLSEAQQWYYDNWKINQDAQQQNFTDYQTELAKLNQWIFDVKSAWLNERKWFANREAQLWREQVNRDRLKQIQLAEQSRNQQAWYTAWAAWWLWWTTWTQALELAWVADKFNIQVWDINKETADQILKVQWNYNNVLRQISTDETLTEEEKIELQKEMAKDLSSMQSSILESQQWLFDKFYDENQAAEAAQAQAQEKLRLEWVKDRTKSRETLEKNFDKFRSEIAWIVNINSDIWNKARAQMTDAALNWDLNAANEVLTNMQSNVYSNPEYKAYIEAVNAKKTKPSSSWWGTSDKPLKWSLKPFNLTVNWNVIQAQWATTPDWETIYRDFSTGEIIDFNKTNTSYTTPTENSVNSQFWDNSSNETLDWINSINQ